MKQKLRVVGIDIAKRVFHLVGMAERGQIILRKRLVRGEVLSFMANLPRVMVGMEACGGAHEWARRLQEQGHDVKLMAPQYVKPYVKTNKNDLRDAEAIAEAVTRPARGRGSAAAARRSPARTRAAARTTPAVAAIGNMCGSRGRVGERGRSPAAQSGVAGVIGGFFTVVEMAKNITFWPEH